MPYEEKHRRVQHFIQNMLLHRQLMERKIRLQPQKKQNNAYWSVDLGKAVNVKQINIINRKDCCGKWLKNIAVTVGQNLNSMKHCSKFKGPGKNGQVIELTCKSPIAGRYVKILRSGKGILGLAEVQVMGNTGKQLIPAKPKGKIVKPAKPKGINYALRRKASQSSTFHSKYAASQAVDGEENTFSATKKQNNAYWSVDLGKTVSVKQINIINRKDCCGNRLKNIAVTVGLNLHKMKHCSKFKGPGKNGQVIELTCKSPIAGRYVKILRSGKEILSLAEVQVIGHTGKKLIAGKPKGKTVKPPKPKGQQCRMNLKGANYGGNISKTKSGRTCQAWGVQTPQKHKFSKKLANQKNYCRNPDNEPHGPWCYTTDAKKRWEYCAIPYCMKKVTPANPIGKKVKPAKPIGKKVKTAKPKAKKVTPAKPKEHNYALRRKSWQSSTQSSRFAASKAVDGVENTFTHTKKQNNPYWTVDLGKTVNVKQINIINRKDCCGHRLKNIEVTVGLNHNKMKHCSHFKGPGKTGQVIKLACKTPISGRYVTISKRGKWYLSLADVQVLGHTGKKEG